MRLAVCVQTSLRKALLGVLHNTDRSFSNIGLPADKALLYQELHKQLGHRRHDPKLKVIKSDMWDILLPPGKVETDATLFDVTLITILIRHCTNLPPPLPSHAGADGWKQKSPQHGDNSVAGNCLNAREFRNYIFHSCKNNISKTDFLRLWNELDGILHGLKYTDDTTEFKEHSLDPYLKTQLDALAIRLNNLEEQGVSQEMNAIKSEMYDVKKRLENVEKSKKEKEAECYMFSAGCIPDEKWKAEAEDLINCIKVCSKKEELMESEGKEVISLILKYLSITNKAAEESYEMFKGTISDKKAYAHDFTRLCEILLRQVPTPSGDESVPSISIIILAHGEICGPLRPSKYYYLSENLEDITLFAPWGCAINAPVAYGIMTNQLEIANVECTQDIFSSLDDRWERKPSHWNILPRNDELIPTVWLKPVSVDSDAFRDLRRIVDWYGLHCEGILLPFVSETGNELIPFNNIPFFTFAHAINVIGILFSKRYNIRLAACLTCYDENVTCQRTELVNTRQYYAAKVSPNRDVVPTAMTTNLNIYDGSRDVVNLMENLFF